MFIREDFKDAIKKQFGIEKMVYKGIERNLFNNCHSFVFDSGRGVVCIEIGLHDIYYVYEVREDFVSSELTYKVKTKLNYFYVFNEMTYLKVNGITTGFSGVAFDFTEELVLLALEGGDQSVH